MKPLIFRQRLPLVFLFALGRLLDLITTFYGLAIGRQEGNVRLLSYGLVNWPLVNVALVLVVILIAWKIRPMIVDAFLASFIVLSFGGVIWNALILLGV